MAGLVFHHSRLNGPTYSIQGVKVKQLKPHRCAAGAGGFESKQSLKKNTRKKGEANMEIYIYV